MAVTSDTPQMFNNTSTGTSHTFSFTIPAGTARLLVVRAAARRGSTGITTITATWGGVSMTEAVTINRSDGSSNHHRASIFYYDAGTGADSTNDIVINGNVSLWYAGSAQTLYGVKQTGGVLGVTGTDSGSDAAATASLTAMTAGSFAVGIGASPTTGTATYAWTNVTEDANYDAFTPAAGSNLSIGGAYYDNAGSSVDFVMTRGSAASHVLCAAEFLPAPVATISLPPPRPTRVYLRL